MSDRQKSKAKIGSIQSMIEFLSNKNQGEEYVYKDITKCLNCQYYRAMGYRGVTCNAEFVRWIGVDEWIRNEPLPPHFDDIARGSYCYCTTHATAGTECRSCPSRNHTFGAALKRALYFLSGECGCDNAPMKDKP